MSKFEVVGINDDKDFCECCGRVGLARVVWIRNTETDEVKHFGTTCATKPVKGFNLDKETKDAVRRADDYTKMVNYITNVEYKRAGGKYQPHPTKEYTLVPMDAMLLNQVKQQVISKGFNY